MWCDTFLWGWQYAGAPRTPTATGEQLSLSSIPDCQTRVFSGLDRSDAFPGPSVFSLDQVIRWNSARSPRASVLTAKVQVWTKECGCHSLFVLEALGLFICRSQGLGCLLLCITLCLLRLYDFFRILLFSVLVLVLMLPNFYRLSSMLEYGWTKLYSGELEDGSVAKSTCSYRGLEFGS